MITIGNNTKIKNSIIGSNKKREKELEKENNNLKEDFKRHIDRINELTNRIDKAIEYIEYYLEEDIINCGNIYHSVYTELLDILKGSDKE